MLEVTDDIIADSQILIYANETYDDLKIRTFDNSQIQNATVNFSSGTGTPPSNFGTLYGDPVDTAGNRYNELTINDFITKPLEKMITLQSGVFKIEPNTAQLIINYYPSYEALTTSQNPEINKYFHELIVYGILSRGFEDLQDPELSKYYGDKYETELLKKAGNLSQYQEENQNDGAMFNYQRLI